MDKRKRKSPEREVMTLAEAARYLRVTENVLRLVAEQEGIPARKVGKEWRFLKPALQDWLKRSEDPGSKERLLQLAGVWKD